MIRVVIDTNVLVSSMIAPLGNEAEIIDAVEAGQICPCFTRDMLHEYALVLNRKKFTFASDEVVRTLSVIADYGQEFPTGVAAPPSPDPTDTKFIACALASGADYLLTGNRRHFPHAFYGKAQVVNASALLARIAAT